MTSTGDQVDQPVPEAKTGHAQDDLPGAADGLGPSSLTPAPPPGPSAAARRTGTRDRRRAARARHARPPALPSRIMISSARCTVPSRCAMMIAVRSRSSLSTARSMSCSVAGSSRDEASSRMTRPGSRKKTRVKASNCASPAESPRPPVSSWVSSPSGSDSYQSRQFQFLDHGVDPLVGNAAVEKGQVVAHAGLEQLHVLGHHRHPLAQRVERRAGAMSTPPSAIRPALGS